MNFWILVLSMAAVAVTILYLFIKMPREPAIDGSGHDRLLYRARLAEIEQDQKIGRLDAETVESAKAEEARKLIRLENSAVPNTATLENRMRTGVVVATLLFVPLFSVGFYLSTGSFNPDTQSTARQLNSETAEQSILVILETAETRLAANPTDAKGWALIAPVYLRMGRTGDAVQAYRNALQYSEREPNLLSALGEAMVIRSNGIVTNEALTLFDEALGVEPGNIRAGYYSGLASAQNGAVEAAGTRWQAIVDLATGDEAWLPRLKKSIANLTGNAALSRTPELGEESLSNAEEMNASDRTEMINQMVASLAERLDENPNDTVGWERLIRSYLVLGRKEDALIAISKARAHFPDDLVLLQKLEKIEGALK